MTHYRVASVRLSHEAWRKPMCLPGDRKVMGIHDLASSVSRIIFVSFLFVLSRPFLPLCTWSVQMIRSFVFDPCLCPCVPTCASTPPSLSPFFHVRRRVRRSCRGCFSPSLTTQSLRWHSTGATLIDLRACFIAAWSATMLTLPPQSTGQRWLCNVSPYWSVSMHIDMLYMLRQEIHFCLLPSFLF